MPAVYPEWLHHEWAHPERVEGNGWHPQDTFVEAHMCRIVSEQSTTLMLPSLLVLFLVTLPTFSFAQEIDDLLKAPAAFDGQQVTVKGTASTPRHNESRGRPFTVFDLSNDQGHSVRVFSWGHLTFREGDKLVVEGIFLKEKQVGQHTIRNEIEARAVNSLADRH